MHDNDEDAKQPGPSIRDRAYAGGLSAWGRWIRLGEDGRQAVMVIALVVLYGVFLWVLASTTGPARRSTTTVVSTTSDWRYTQLSERLARLEGRVDATVEGAA